VATFRIKATPTHGPARTVEIVLRAKSFAAAAAALSASGRYGDLISIECTDDFAVLELSCAACGHLADYTVEWSTIGTANTNCSSCRRKILVDREVLGSELNPTKSGALANIRTRGQPAEEGADHVRKPSISDRIRATFEDPAWIGWQCPECGSEARTPWGARFIAQACAKCGTQFFLQGSAFCWQSRMMHNDSRTRNEAAKEERRRNDEEAKRSQRRRDQERAERAKAEADRKAQELKLEREIQEAAEQIARRISAVASDCAGAGLLRDRDDFHRLNIEDQQFLLGLHEMCDELKSDFLQLFDSSAAFERGIQFGRIGLAGATLATALQGNLGSLALGAATVGIRVLQGDALRAKQAEIRAKWIRRLADFKTPQLDALAALFAYRSPILAQALGGIRDG
jgi:hypothetical protein